MRRYSVGYFIGQSVRGLWRNGIMSTASIMVLMSCLTVLGSFALLVYNIDYNLDEIGIFNEILVYIEDDRTELEVADIGNQIRALENVASVELKTKAEVLEEERERFSKFPSLFEIIDEKIYPDTFTVTYIDNMKFSTLEYQLERIPGVKSLSVRWALAESVENLKHGIILVFVWFLAILFVVSVFVIINTIKLAVFARRQEISIMRYVGATNWFITLPFVFEGMLIGIISSGAAFFIQWYFYEYIQKIVITDYQMISVVNFADVRLYVLAGFAAIGILTGIMGSIISLSKYLKA